MFQGTPFYSNTADINITQWNTSISMIAFRIRKCPHSLQVREWNITIAVLYSSKLLSIGHYVWKQYKGEVGMSHSYIKTHTAAHTHKIKWEKKQLNDEKVKKVNKT